MKKSIKIIHPKMPNFVRFEQPPGSRQDGFKELPAMDIADFTEEEAMEFAQLMHDKFLEHYRSRRRQNEKKTPPPYPDQGDGIDLNNRGIPQTGKPNWP